MELRMYGLVNYQLSPIQQGIQFGHAVVEYGIGNSSSEYKKWSNEDKTFIILNGRTTNTNPNKLGTLNKHLESLKLANIKVADFYEPDLGDQLTAVVFLVDERVFNRELYPDYDPILLDKFLPYLNLETKKYKKWCKRFNSSKEELEKILFLRSFLKNFKLA